MWRCVKVTNYMHVAVLTDAEYDKCVYFKAEAVEALFAQYYKTEASLKTDMQFYHFDIKFWNVVLWLKSSDVTQEQLTLRLHQEKNSQAE